MPTSDEADLRQALEQFSISTPFTTGLTIGYGVFLLRGSLSDAQLARQLKRVAQFESCEGIPSFFGKHIAEVNEYGRDRAPLEVEAREFAACEFLV